MVLNILSIFLKTFVQYFNGVELELSKDTVWPVKVTNLFHFFGLFIVKLHSVKGEVLVLFGLFFYVTFEEVVDSELGLVFDCNLESVSSDGIVSD